MNGVERTSAGTAASKTAHTAGAAAGASSPAEVTSHALPQRWLLNSHNSSSEAVYHSSTQIGSGIGFFTGSDVDGASRGSLGATPPSYVSPSGMMNFHIGSDSDEEEEEEEGEAE